MSLKRPRNPTKKNLSNFYLIIAEFPQIFSKILPKFRKSSENFSAFLLKYPNNFSNFYLVIFS